MKRRWLNAMTASVFIFYAGLYGSAVFAPDRDTPSVEKARVIDSLKEKEEIARRNLGEHPEIVSVFALAFVALFFWGLWMDVYLAARRARGLPWPALSQPMPSSAWGGRDVFDAFMFLLFVEACLVFLPGQALLYTLLRDGVVAAFVWMLVKERGQGARHLGLHLDRTFSSVRTGVLGYVAIVPPLILTFHAVSAAVQYFRWEPVPQNVVQMYLDESAAPYLVPLTVFVALIGPVMEEIFFRGFAYAGLRRRFGAFGGACVSSAAFAALHMHWVAFAPIFLLGLFLSYLYECTGSLVPSITAHMLHNGIMIALMLGFKGISS